MSLKCKYLIFRFKLKLLLEMFGTMVAAKSMRRRKSTIKMSQ